MNLRGNPEGHVFDFWMPLFMYEIFMRTIILFDLLLFIVLFDRPIPLCRNMLNKRLYFMKQATFPGELVTISKRDSFFYMEML